MERQPTIAVMGKRPQRRGDTNGITDAGAWDKYLVDTIRESLKSFDKLKIKT